MHCLGQLLSTAVDLLTARDLGGLMPENHFSIWNARKIVSPPESCMGKKSKNLFSSICSWENRLFSSNQLCFMYYFLLGQQQSGITFHSSHLTVVFNKHSSSFFQKKRHNENTILHIFTFF